MDKFFRAVSTLLMGCFLALGGCAPLVQQEAQGEEETLTVKIPYANEELEGQTRFESDILVIGGGLAGLCAATTAAEAGCSVILIDKMPMIGGNSILSTGTFNAVDPDRQSAQGIEDSIELFIKNTYEGGDMLGNLDLITLLCENAGDARNWIESHGGKWSTDGVYLASGGTWPRSLDVEVSPNETFIRPLAFSIIDGGGKIFSDMKACSLIVQGGRVTGVEAVNTRNQKNYVFYGKRGVVMATGGFGANSEMIAAYCQSIPPYVEAETTPAATGDGILMAQAVGADVVDMEYVQMVPGAVNNGPYFTNEASNAIYVNQQGARFVSEQCASNVISQAILEQPGRIAYMLFDSNTIGDSFVDGVGRTVEELRGLAREGLCGYGETLEELAQSIGIEPDALEKTVAEFNQAVDGEAADPFGRELFYKKFGDGPFFAAIRTAKIHYTMGGLRIDTDARVLDAEGVPISGLYACGEVTGGIHAANHVTGNALADCVVFGRIAGQSAVDGR